jgi:hypothetical protein
LRRENAEAGVDAVVGLVGLKRFLDPSSRISDPLVIATQGFEAGHEIVV